MSFQQQIALCCTLLLVAAVSGLPQVWNIGIIPDGARGPLSPNQQRPQPQVDANTITSTAAPAAPSTTPPPQYFACLARCPVTSEYNPICGSDRVNYSNLGRLQCAVRCGMNVTAVRSGTCAAL